MEEQSFKHQETVQELNRARRDETAELQQAIVTLRRTLEIKSMAEVKAPAPANDKPGARQ